MGLQLGSEKVPEIARADSDSADEPCHEQGDDNQGELSV
jgi:hypothetical protein